MQSHCNKSTVSEANKKKWMMRWKYLIIGLFSCSTPPIPKHHSPHQPYPSVEVVRLGLSVWRLPLLVGFLFVLKIFYKKSVHAISATVPLADSPPARAFYFLLTHCWYWQKPAEMNIFFSSAQITRFSFQSSSLLAQIWFQIGCLELVFFTVFQVLGIVSLATDVRFILKRIL